MKESASGLWTPFFCGLTETNYEGDDMRLSEAMRQGAKLGGKLIGSRHTDDGEPSSCALGAAENAILKSEGRQYGSWVDSGFMMSEFRWPWIRTLEIDIPCNDKSHRHEEYDRSMIHRIVVLNNNCDWSREAIAEWVETIENKLEVGDKQEAVGGKPIPPACSREDVVAPELYPVEVK